MIFSKITDVAELQKNAYILRRNIIEMIGIGNRGHYGGSLSPAELVAALYFNIMNHDPQNPKWKQRDRFVLSKGHAAPVQYAALGECGYFPKSEFLNYKKIDALLQGHPDMEKTPGVEANTGSLGQGLSLGIGMALGVKKDKLDSRVYVIMGDGEMGEGQVWEAATVAPHYKLDNLVAVIDKNNVQAMGFTRDRINQGDLASKWRAFGWEVFEIDGHNMKQVIETFNLTRNVKGKPCAIVADTIKGKGVSFAENTATYHNNEMNAELYKKAMEEIDGVIKYYQK
jgi:transketolase